MTDKDPRAMSDSEIRTALAKAKVKPTIPALFHRIVGILRAAGKRGLSEHEIRMKVGLLVDGTMIVLEELVSADRVKIKGKRRGTQGETPIYYWQGD